MKRIIAGIIILSMITTAFPTRAKAESLESENIEIVETDEAAQIEESVDTEADLLDDSLDEEIETVDIEAGAVWKFDFGGKGAATGYTGVSATDKYTTSKKYGFSNTNSVRNVTASGAGALSDAVAFDNGVPFNVDLDNGVYKITVTTGSDNSTIIYAEDQRQLFFLTGDNATDSFTIPITDGQLNIYASIGAHSHEYSLSTLEIEKISSDTVTKPTIWILGDSTVASYYNIEDDVRHGWGQYLSDYVDSDEYIVRNLAVKDLSAKDLNTFSYSTVDYYGKEGDICVVAVGFDKFLEYYGDTYGSTTKPNDSEYKAEITTLTKKAKAKGMKVILVKQQGLYDDCIRYPLIKERWYNDAIDEVAETEQVEVIDLFQLWLTFCLESTFHVSVNYYEEHGAYPNVLGAKKLAQIMEAAMFAEEEIPQPVQEDDPTFNTASTITYETEVSGGPVANPHKGYVITAYTPDDIKSTNKYGIGGAAKNGAWDVATIVNGVHYWKNLNPKEGEYDWSEIDAMLDTCEEYGLTYVIRVLPYSHMVGDHDNYGADHILVPQWVFDKNAQKKRVKLEENQKIELDVPVWDDPIYLQACRDFAAALAKKYDGDPRVELIDIRPFGNWGEWHFSQVIGSDMPSVQDQIEMLDYYKSVFKKTLIAVPTDAWGEVYEHALSIGVAKRDDGMIGTANGEWNLRLSYKANVPAIAENLGTYNMMLKYGDGPYGSIRWTPERFKECIEIAHLTMTAFDQDSKCGYQFYKEQKNVIDEMVNRLGYNFTVTSAKRNGNKLQVKIKNTGVAPCYFNIDLCAEIVDANGKKMKAFGQPIKIEKGTFHDEEEKTYVFEYAGTLSEDAIITLAMYDCDNTLVQGKDPTVRFDNKNNLSTNRLQLVPSYKGWKQLDGKWYFFNSQGAKQTGWVAYGGKWYYMDNQGVMKTGWLKVDDKWYYFNDGGAMVTGWKQIKGIWYYFNDGGAMVTGWKQIKGSWYYFNDGGAMVTGWKQIKGIWYYFNDGGAMAIGWKQIKGIWYYFNDGGAMAIGWKQIKDCWYYFGTDGAMASNTTLTINGKQYIFNASGKWIK